MTTQRCAEPGCPGTIEDGWCDYCGAPAPAPGDGPAGGPAPGVSASSGVSASAGTSAPSVAVARGSSRTSSSRLASSALGSARNRGTGSRATRQVGTSSTRLRGHRLGAGLTTVPSVPVADPADAVMREPEVPEHKRYCPACGAKVGRAHGDAPGRSQGFCPQCGARFDFTPQLAPGDVVGGQYEVAGCLAHGGLGWIYLARDRNVSGRWVVLKGLLNSGDADAYAAAISERQFLAEVEHPLIVEIYNFAMHDDAGYTVMEYVGGLSLKEILTHRRAAAGRVDPLPVDQAIAYVLEVLPAFAYLHDRGLLFCDFKPDNIIQQGDGVKLIDLGGVRRADDYESAIYGTVGFQAPEVAEVGPSVASDVYTIGRTLATLVLDFRGNTSTYVASLPPVAETPVLQRYDSFSRLLAKACAPDPSDRFATVDELRAQLLGVLREVVATDRRPVPGGVHSSASVLFHSPRADVAGRPLRWDELPALRVDEHDPGAAWLAGVAVADPRQRLAALAAAPVPSVEVQLARALAAIEAGLHEAAHETIHEVLAEDPWEWRAAWLEGLDDLAAGDLAGAAAAFNAVYGQVPGELAPKLALAAACEPLGEVGVAEALYVVCARTDANYTPPAAFGLARIRELEDDLDGALAALDQVGSTRGSYVDARLRRARLLAGSGRGLDALADAAASVDAVALAPRDRATLAITVLGAALDVVQEQGPEPGLSVGGVAAEADALRDGLEAAYRGLAALTEGHAERVVLVDRANDVRRWTLR
ncbi:serine/threonine-protein kinase [Cellulomonas sp. PhB143]|uniref:serine/threonine-protein kinase n=1 Tax=Cellulomonas sp. PhB143 TaxID=2485186 RepID=UPI000F47E4C5|nr:serine/threonine-protein kinase [Cellulomonas sp. PhB143]ROS77036.1 serine/threonine-protein kinase PknG [Cellulomonas sp. PhB143]